MVVMKLIPHLLSWAGIVLVLLRGFPGRRSVVTATSIVGFVLGVVGALILFRVFPGTMPFSGIKSALGASFLILWGISVVAIYRSTGRGGTDYRGNHMVDSSYSAGVVSGLAGILAGAVCACRLPEAAGNALTLAIIALTAAVLAYFLTYAARSIEKLLPAFFTVSLSGMLAAVVALLLFSSSPILRLDLFSPLSMKVMKGFHDFVHQFMESVLIPDHFFVRPVVWKLIGLLFSKEVGFWGGMVIWFIPALLIALAIGSERLPSVAQIRQGAQRRKVLAAAISARRYRLVIPVLSVVIFAAAAYQSCFPSVEYWDPKPVQVTASPAGEIFIPKKGEVDLLDGKLHKYLLKQGNQEARFFVLMSPTGQLTVDLDACAICKPDGYGQAEGSVICYYCKTLIPLETVGKSGGCNPVPVQFTEKADGVVVDGLTLINSWSATVQATTRIKEGGK
jgi:Membrane iron-sulfur containing protein FtrD-like